MTKLNYFLIAIILGLLAYMYLSNDDIALHSEKVDVREATYSEGDNTVFEEQPSLSNHTEAASSAENKDSSQINSPKIPEQRADVNQQKNTSDARSRRESDDVEYSQTATIAQKEVIDKLLNPNGNVKLTEQEASLLLPSPYHNAITGDIGSTLAEDYGNFANSPEDFDWGYQMEIKIRDYISLHEHAGGIQIETIKCKIETCEILGLELSERGWSRVLNEMTYEEWWSFRNVHTSKRSSKEFGDYFFVLIN